MLGKRFPETAKRRKPVNHASATSAQTDIVEPVSQSSGQLPVYVTYPGQLAIVNLCSLLASIPVVTALAAGAAMQGTLERLRAGESRPVAAFVQEFRAQLPRLVWLG